MDVKISGNNNGLLSDITIKPQTKLPEEKKASDKTHVNTENKPVKDTKSINQNLIVPVKSEPVKFVDKYQLTKQRIEGSTGASVSVKIATKALTTTTKTVGKTVTKKATEDVGKVLAKSIWVNASQTVVMSAGEEITLKAIEKSAKVATKKGSEEAGKKLSGAVPIVGAVIEAGFTLYDAKYAYELTKDKKATITSKALAWATVGLDAVSMVCTATGVGTPIAWAATGLSVVTAVASDMTKYKH